MVRGEVSSARHAERQPKGWATLAAVLAATTTATAAYAQAPAEAPPAAQGQEEDVVLLEADQLTNDENANTITAEGDVQVRYQGRTMRADRIIYNLDTGDIRAIGGVEMVEPSGDITTAEEMQVDEALTLGVATELRARLGGVGTVAARTAVRRSEGESALSNVIYTSCPICVDGSRPPTWALRARSAVQNTDTKMISYRDVTLNVSGVPVLYLPYFSHPDPSAGPRSGLLIPDLGRNRRLGTYYEQPYHWAISPYQDLTLTGQVHSRVHPLLGAEYRKRFWSGDLQLEGTITHEQDFDGDGETFGPESTRAHIFGFGRFRINDYWQWGFGAERASDDLYLRRYDIDGAGERRGPYLGTNTRLISQLYTEGQDARSFASAAVVSFQGLRESDDTTLLPVILPVAAAERVYRDPILDGQLKLQASTAVLHRTEGNDSARATAGFDWRADTVFGPGWVVSPFAQARGDAYRVDDASGDETITRGLGLAGVELSWPFIRPGRNVDVLVEPVAMGAIGTDGGANDPRIPNEDSLGFELDDSNLFRPNAAPNYDLWEPGGRIALGVRAAARAANGNAASALIGRRWRDEDEPAFNPDTNLSGRASDWVGAAEVDLGRNFGAQVRFRLEDESLELQRTDASVRAAVWRVFGQARYYSIDRGLNPGAPAREIYTTVGADLVRGWQVQYGIRRDLDSDINLSQDLRAIYRDDCTFLELAYTRSETFDRRLGPNEGFQIRIGLTSLGVFGGGD
ncbi:MAG: LPS assembly protein LptD [Alphaproteobacteria bacterium]|nr:LPS assembly protein LptD [Alphaproteobacteria bacterium]